jgi:hypothetical protein
MQTNSLILFQPLGVFYSITMLAKYLRARLATPSPMELTSYSVKKRMRQNAWNHGSVRFDAYIVASVIPGDEVMPTDSDRNLSFFLGREVPCNEDKYHYGDRGGK